jgi:RPA family protein
MEVFSVDVRLFVDGRELVLNEFVRRVLSGMVVGCVTSLQGVKEDWREIRIEVAKPTG